MRNYYIILFYILFYINNNQAFILNLFSDLASIIGALDRMNSRNRKDLYDSWNKFYSATANNKNLKNNNINIDLDETNDIGLQKGFAALAGKISPDVIEITDFLKNSSKYKALGIEMPRGILLVGPPGNGKTSIARAIAEEAGVEFYNINGSDFIEVYVGVGSQRVRELFDKARKCSPAIIFIDEIDAIAQKRGKIGGNMEYDNTLIALLNEMDGFKRNSDIIVIAATNNPGVLDPAIKRPGRFDRIVEIGMPDQEDRLDIIKLYFKNKKNNLSELDFNKLAEDSNKFSRSEIKDFINEAAFFAVRSEIDFINYYFANQGLQKTKQKKVLAL